MTVITCFIAQLYQEFGSPLDLAGTGGGPVFIWAVGLISSGSDLMAHFFINFFIKILSCHMSRSEPLKINPTTQMGTGPPPVPTRTGGDPNSLFFLFVYFSHPSILYSWDFWTQISNNCEIKATLTICFIAVSYQTSRYPHTQMQCRTQLETLLKALHTNYKFIIMLTYNKKTA